MTAPVCAGALLQCTCGSVPSLLAVPSRSVFSTPGPELATIEDCLPLVNIAPFGGCIAPANLSPLPGKPCTPLPVGSWPAVAPGVMVAGIPALVQSAVLPCQFGGVISIVTPCAIGISLATGAG